mgnify:FL=1
MVFNIYCCISCILQMSNDNPFVIPEMDPSLRTQVQECNWQVVNITTPANYFHVLRRQVRFIVLCVSISGGLFPFQLVYVILIMLFWKQIHRDFRKPLIVMAPKNLLRHPACKSNLSEFDDVQGHPGFDKQGTRFKRLIKDQNLHSDREETIRRLVLCSGKASICRPLKELCFNRFIIRKTENNTPKFSNITRISCCSTQFTT